MMTSRLTDLHMDVQRGLSLIELMISLTIGMLVVLGIGTVYLSSRQTFRTQETLSHMQEGARYAFEMMSHDIRMVGYSGCANAQLVTPTVEANTPPDFTKATILFGYEHQSGWANPSTISEVANTDVLRVSYASENGVDLSSDMAGAGTDIVVSSNPDGLKNGQALVISDCASVDVFRASNVSGSGPTTIQHDASQNTSASLSKAYVKDTGSSIGARVYALNENQYFIGTNPNGEPALYRYTITSGKAEELVEGVDGMEIEYGEDTNNDGSIDSFNLANAVADWSKVLAVRINLLMRSTQDNVSTGHQVYKFYGSTNTAGDNRLREAFTTTIAVRNRL